RNFNYQDIEALFGSGGLQQQYNQAQLDVPYQDWLTEKAYPFETLNWLASLYGGIGPLTGSTTSGTQTTPKPSMFSQILGGVAQGVGAYLGASDERLKSNIEPVGETYDGLPIYTYNMPGHPEKEMGVLAQEVAQVRPEAVGDMGGGILGVDYGQLTQRGADPGYRAYDDIMLRARLMDGAISPIDYQNAIDARVIEDRGNRRILGETHRMDFMPGAEGNP